MSSKKIYTTMGLDREVFERLQLEAAKERRSKSFTVEKILRDYFALPWGRGVKETTHADKT